ncbi:flagellar hook-basal body complex protein FliE [Pseudorhodobacter turbinis]|uniref:Flagellar hook-basal body complex protein FliE n=1 Tax=Pseudorhodobacter turbinis TaxID=2500533 RepID=A0A4V1E0P2_9RHOB|nr:flagellar hook-basal body complex protein FliE [Pseudorhodobacter turbinis]QCO55324.1 flagellar hook-basal body complex protein FliE [Pseudorhodobacter turbinis]
MDIKTSVAAQSYAIARQAALPEPKTEGADNAFTKMAESFANTLVTGETTAKAALVGDADPHSLVQALAATETAIETVVTVRDKVVEAYQELLRMPV